MPLVGAAGAGLTDRGAQAAGGYSSVASVTSSTAAGGSRFAPLTAAAGSAAAPARRITARRMPPGHDVRGRQVSEERRKRVPMPACDVRWLERSVRGRAWGPGAGASAHPGPAAAPSECRDGGRYTGC
jgi:hypothetical protein